MFEEEANSYHFMKFLYLILVGLLLTITFFSLAAQLSSVYKISIYPISFFIFITLLLILAVNNGMVKAGLFGGIVFIVTLIFLPFSGEGGLFVLWLLRLELILIFISAILGGFLGKLYYNLKESRKNIYRYVILIMPVIILISLIIISNTTCFTPLNIDHADSCKLNNAIATNNVDICIRISEDYYKNQCFYKLAISLKDTSICSNLENNNYVHYFNGKDIKDNEYCILVVEGKARYVG